MVCAVSTFGVMDTLAKLLGQHYSAPVVVWVRYLFQMIAMIVVLGPQLRLGLLRTTNLRFQIIRGIVLVTSSLCFFSALKVMPLAEASALTYLSPLLVAALAGPVLHERVAPITWVALIGGMVGVVLIVRPGSSVFSWGAMLPIFTACLMAVYHIMTRKLAGRDRALTTLFYPSLVGALITPIMFPISATQWVTPTDLSHIAMFAALGIGGAIGHLLLIKAMDHAPATTLAPFVYSQIVIVIVLGYLVFGQLPDAWATAGIAVIVGSGLAVAIGYRFTRD
jgi:drug/metabolite transporter (DMT)-like permease